MRIFRELATTSSRDNYSKMALGMVNMLGFVLQVTHHGSVSGQRVVAKTTEAEKDGKQMWGNSLALPGTPTW